MSSIDENTRTIVRRGGLVVLSVGALASIAIYFCHDWFHGTLLPALGIGPALGDAVGGFAIIVVAYFGQRFVSLMLFRDIALGSIRNAHQLQEANRMIQAELCELDQLAGTDKLTGAWNRRRLEDALAGEIERQSRYGHPLSMLVLDVDHFKRVNDQHGHAVGDTVLVEFAGRLRQVLRATDMLVRWGGEEFIVLCPNTPLKTATRLAHRLHQRVRDEAFPVAGQVTVSIGVAECLGGDTWETWFSRADQAVYRAKHDGRDRVHAAPNPLESPDSVPAVDAGFVRLVWRTAYESGHPGIDRQHRDLFELANDLLSALMSARPTDEIAEIIGQLVANVGAHFAYEEAVIAGTGYPDITAHNSLHRDLAGRAKEMAERFSSGTLEVGELFQFLAHDVVVKHILGADREFFPWLPNPAKTSP
jgi:diguanylate cyclase (GGDEF)-like protein/hemerythrin-like metal-binding protein